MELLRIELTGEPLRALPEAAHEGARAGLIGVEVTGRDVDGVAYTVVQALFDDDRDGFDRSLLDGPLVAEVVEQPTSPGPPAAPGADDGVVVERQAFDHDAFRRQLLDEHRAGESVTRGVLVLTGGELPPPWVRLAFLPVGLERTAGAELVVRRTTVGELLAGVEAAHRAGVLDDDQRGAALSSIRQLHPPGAG